MLPVGDEPTGFLYPFLEHEERDVGALLLDLAASARTKIAESDALRATTRKRCESQLQAVGEAMAQRFRRGGRLFTFGNGGSATDADATAQLFREPEHGCSLPAKSLVDEPAVLTALANDVGFDLVFSRQIIAHAREDDIAMGFSTSGDSVNVLTALEEGVRRKLLTVGFAGCQGGAMTRSRGLDYCLVVHSDSVHRVQECQSALVSALWSIVQRALRDAARS